MENKLVTVIVLQYNGAILTENLLRSIVKFESANIQRYNIIIADNNSTEDDRLVYFKNEFPFATYIKNEKNYGFAVAVNQIARKVNTPFTLLLNNDIILKEDSINKTLQEAIRLKADGITCEMIDGSGVLMNNFSSNPKPILYPLNFLGISFLWRKWVRHRSTTSRVYYINGGFLLLNTLKFQKIGMFTERFFMYTEDLDLTLRMNKMNYKLYYYPSTSIIHYDGKSSEKVWSTYEKEELLMTQAMSVYKENSSYISYKVFASLWCLKEYLKFTITKDVRCQYRFKYLKTTVLSNGVKDL